MAVFARVSDARITEAIVRDFCNRFAEKAKTEVVVVGGGPSGLMCARDLASNGVAVTVIESNNYLGGGFWMGGYLMNGVTFREPSEKILDELSIPHKKVADGLHMTPGPHACSRLIAAACDAGVEIFNMTRFDDIVIRENDRVSGVVVNSSAVASLPKQVACVDPVSIEAEVVVDATGHDAVVASSLQSRGLIEIKGCGAMWADTSEDLIVEKTGEVHPGLFACGMAVSAIYGIPRMGPTFGAMLVSGRRAAEQIAGKLAQ